VIARHAEKSYWKASESCQVWKRRSGTEKKQSMTVIYDPMVISPEEIKQAIANSGHDTDSIKATAERYDLLPDCCKYERNKTDKKLK